MLATALFPLFTASCAAAPTILPASQQLTEKETIADNQKKRQSSPRLIRHVLVGYGKSVYELQSARINAIFEEGTVDGWIIEEDYTGCALYSFSIYAFNPTNAKTNQIFINGNLFQRFRTDLTGVLNEMFWPLGYTSRETAELFDAADLIVAEYNRLLLERTDKVMHHTDKHGPYNLLHRKKISVEPHCKQYDGKLTPKILKKFSP